MPNQLRSILGRPISPGQARLAFALSATVISLAAVLLITHSGHGAAHQHPPQPTPTATVSIEPQTVTPPPSTGGGGRRPRQDPQDRRGSRAARRAARALSTHRALQHVPYHHGRIRIELTGAHDGRAILTVTGPSRRLARAGWRHFLARFHDAGRAYDPRLKVDHGRTPRRSRGGR